MAKLTAWPQLQRNLGNFALSFALRCYKHLPKYLSGAQQLQGIPGVCELLGMLQGFLKLSEACHESRLGL